MKIKKFINQHRRDFTAVYQCESCGHEKESSGYDDRNFHDLVIPSMKCDACKESRDSLGIKQDPTPTKYAPWEVI